MNEKFYLWESEHEADRAAKIFSAFCGLLNRPYQAIREAKTLDEETRAKNEAVDQIVILMPVMELYRDHLERLWRVKAERKKAISA